MKKQIGIARNRLDRLNQIKKEVQRKKNRFQMVGKQEQEDNNMFSLTTTHSDPVSFAELAEEGDQSTRKAVQLFKEARNKMIKVAELQKKMGQISKLRLTCLRQKQNEKYDENVSKLAGEATKFILTAQGLMRQISNIEVNSATSKKILKSMQAALAGQVQQASRSLRSQQQEYFKRIKAYEMTTNSAIQLTAEQRKSMQGEWELVEEKQQNKQNSKISELVSSISKLSTVYKELGQLVVTQGTVIDRIDYNLQQTQQHTAKAVVHLKNADAEVSSPFADKVIKSLFGAIILLAIILALKYMN